MIKALMGSALALVVVVGAASDADAFTRKRTTVGPYGGQSNFSANVECYGNSCTRNATRRGAYGNTVNRSATMTCEGGACVKNSSTEGPWHRGISSSTVYTR